MEDKLFKQTGRFSKVWYIKIIKDNPTRRGFSWIRKEETGAPQFDTLKAVIKLLVDERLIDPVGKPDGKGSTFFKPTSLGHRYLEAHKDELPSEGLQNVQERIDAANAKIAADGLKKMGESGVTTLTGRTFKVQENVDPKYTHEDTLEPHRKQKLTPLGIIPVEPLLPEGVEPAPDLAPDPKQPDTEGLAWQQGKTQPLLHHAVGDEKGLYWKPSNKSKAEPSKEEKRALVLRRLVGDALIEKFGDKMTVKELLETVEEETKW